MLTFASDYTTGCCPEILDRLIATNLEPQTGYGTDQYCASAAEKIKPPIRRQKNRYPN